MGATPQEMLAWLAGLEALGELPPALAALRRRLLKELEAS